VGVGGEWGEGSAAKRRSLRVGSPNDRQFSTRSAASSLLFHATPPPLSLHRTAVASLRHPSTTNITTTTRGNHARSHAGGIPSSLASVVRHHIDVESTFYKY
jgi:hypothetical protein